MSDSCKGAVRIGRLAVCLMVWTLGILIGTGLRAQAAVKDADVYRAVFRADYYYSSNPDLQKAVGNDETALFSHFVNHGIWEGRSGDGEFYLYVYMMENPDLFAAFGLDYPSYCRHYVEHGKAEGRKASGEDGEEGESIQLLASCTTSYSERASRATNIHTAVSRLNGVVVEPGASFSFTATILPRTTANGYVEAPVFINKQVSTGIGGGICQVSSTLYSAMLDGGIAATERHAHSLPITYLPAGRDATIAGTAKDLKFVNTTGSPILIGAMAQNGKLTVALIRR